MILGQELTVIGESKDLHGKVQVHYIEFGHRHFMVSYQVLNMAGHVSCISYTFPQIGEVVLTVGLMLRD